MFYRYFLPVCTLPFNFLNVFWSINVLTCDQVQFILFLLWLMPFIPYLKKYLPSPESQRFSCFLLGVLMILAFSVRSTTHSELMFVYMVWGKALFIFFSLWISHYSSTVCWKEYPSPPELLWHLCKIS